MQRKPTERKAVTASVSHNPSLAIRQHAVKKKTRATIIPYLVARVPQDARGRLAARGKWR